MGIARRRFGIGLLAVLILVPVAAFAWQSTTDNESVDRVRLSVDGAQWTPVLEDAFFYSDTPWEPGEVRTAIFWARNASAAPGDLTITVLRSAGEELVEDGALIVSLIVDDRTPQHFDADLDRNVVRVGEVESGGVVTLTLRAVLTETPEPQVVNSVGLRYQVTGTGRPVEGGSRSMLAADEAHLVLAPVFLGVALLVTAWVMSSPSRSRPRRER